ncbi:MAG: hypothetical protein JO332_17915 [Planctomycetaceae bacterium]|nr:hypothetical protein [Planctomycetaceae bacterium]
MSLFALVLVAFVSPDDYYDPIVRFKRELEALRTSRAQVQARIDEAADAIRKDAVGFYKAHEADCEKKDVQADGSFNFVYLPAREWNAQKKRFQAAMGEKERELLAAYDEAIARLIPLNFRLLRRFESWGESINRLKAVEKDLKGQEEEWRKTMLLAGWDFVNEFIPAMSEGLRQVNVRLERPAKGSYWYGVDPEVRLKLRDRIDAFEKTSGMLAHATKALFSGVDAAKQKDTNEAGKKVVEAGQELSELFADILKETVIGATKEQRAEFAQARAAVAAFVAITKAGSVYAAGGTLDEPTRVELSNAGIAVVKFVGEFNPVSRFACGVFSAGAAATETGIAASAWWTVWSSERKNEDNLDWARRMTAAAREDQEAVSARIEAYKTEKAALLERQGK